MQNSYPYTLPPEGWYHLHPLAIPESDRIDFFYKYKRETENIYVGGIYKNHLKFDYSRYVIEYFSKYLTESLFLKDATRDSHLSIKLLPKVCWLAKSFLEEGLKYPVCVHYNPRIKENVMHPGSTRNYIIKLFHQNKFVNCLYFNTGGVQFKFMEDLLIVTKEQMKSYTNASINLVPDHCSIIPHINLEPNSVRDNIPVWQDKIRKRLTDNSLKIHMNEEVEVLRPWLTTSDKANVHIKIARVGDHSDLLRAYILAIIGKSYSSPTLTVTVQDD